MITYTYLVRHIVPGPQSVTWFIPLLALPVALLIPRTVLSRWQSICTFMPIITLSVLHAWYAMGTVDVITSNALLWSAFLLAIRDPWRDFRWVEDIPGDKSTNIASTINGNDGDESDDAVEVSPDPTQSLLPTKPATAEDVKEVPYPSTLSQRLPWVGLLIVSIRLFGWRIGYPSHDRRQPTPSSFSSRSQFLLVSVTASIAAYLTLDVTHAYIQRDEYFTNPGLSYSSQLAISLGIYPLIFRTAILAAQLLSFMGLGFFFPATFAVLLNLIGLVPDFWSPHTWPSYLGPPSAMMYYGVRGFWGRFWHQTMRWTVSGPGIAISDALRLYDRGVVRFVLVNAVAFFLSGFIHMGLVPPEPIWATISVGEIRWCLLGFFWVQSLGIILEAAMAWLILRLTGVRTWQTGIGWWTRAVVTLMWVYLWFTMTTIPLFEAGRQLGWWRVWPVPVSFWQGLRGEGWLAWDVLKSSRWPVTHTAEQ